MRKYIKSQLVNKALIVFTAALVTSVTASADDIEVYMGGQAKPNILFVLDYSGSMAFDVDGERIDEDDTTTLSKDSILKTAVSSLLEDNIGKINVGIASIYKEFTSGVRWPISDLADDASLHDSEIPYGTATVSEVISGLLDRSPVRGYTATVNALAEAAAYYRGDKVLNGSIDPSDYDWHKPDRWIDEQYQSGNHMSALPNTYTPKDAYMYDPDDSSNNVGSCIDYLGGDQECEGRSTYDCQFVAANDSSVVGISTTDRDICSYRQVLPFVAPSYTSPLTTSCQSNFIVLISDGQPSTLNSTETLETVLAGAGVSGGNIEGCEDLSVSVFNESEDGDEKHFGNCGPEILDYLASNDINPDVPESSVKTFAIGFSLEGAGKDYLELLAEKGQGEFYEASKPEELTDALNSIFDTIITGSENFAELSIDIDPTSFSHDDSTYFSLFAPGAETSWQGNLKGYFLDDGGLIDIYGDDATVTDEAGLRFSDTAHSFWSSQPDGNETLMGGASESITELEDPAEDRRLYTYKQGNNNFTRNSDNKINADSNKIKRRYLGADTTAEKTTLLEWIVSAPMGDPLHTKPVIVNYDDKKIVFTMTNQGILHAFNATYPSEPQSSGNKRGGSELFAYMPWELLPNISRLADPDDSGEHVYGLDGTITRWHEDENEDGIVNGNDTMTLILGMRRGGTSYYALDVTKPSYPKYKWQIDAGANGFDNLAQTWSRASLVSVKRNGNTERVLMFGGGYDADVVDDTTTATPASGNAIFMVDADGDLIWSLDNTDHPDMIYSIPSDLSIIDSDQDGMVDRAYFGDLGGQVWRADFDDVASASGTTLTKFADVSNGDHQPLFYAPSVSKNQENGETFLALAFGSGDRTQPLLTTTQNAFFMLKDKDYEVGEPSASFTTITSIDLFDATDNDVGSDNESIKELAEEAMSVASGWTVYLEPGEKALSKVVTFENKILATTFEPTTTFSDTGDIDSCSVGTTGRLYIMNLLDAQPIEISADGAENIASPDAGKRTTVLSTKMGIPSTPVIVFPAESSQVQIIVGKESLAKINKQIRTVFWHAQ